jgi:hypothetical protein
MSISESLFVRLTFIMNMYNWGIPVVEMIKNFIKIYFLFFSLLLASEKRSEKLFKNDEINDGFMSSYCWYLC